MLSLSSGDAKDRDLIPEALSPGVSSVGYYVPAAVTSRLQLCGMCMWVSAEPLVEKPPLCVLLVATPTEKAETAQAERRSKAVGQF